MLKISLYKLIILFIFFVVNFSTLAEEKGYLPKINLHDKWQIECTYRLSNLTKKMYGKPIIWEFEVKNRKQINGIDCWIIHVKQIKPKSANAQAILCLAISDLRPVQVIDVFRDKNRKLQTKVRNYNLERISPLLSNESIIPYDMPLFPLMAESPSGELIGGGFTGESIYNVDDDVCIEAVRQEWTKTSNGWYVKLQTYTPHGTITQLWQEGKPWATEMHSEFVKYRLVEK